MGRLGTQRIPQNPMAFQHLNRRPGLSRFRNLFVTKFGTNHPGPSDNSFASS
jgi:hypothetical protein